MADAVAEGVLVAFERLLTRLQPNANNLLEWLREVARPPPGIELRAADGTLFTGMAVFERNKIIIMVAAATGQSPAARAPIPLAASIPSSYMNTSPSYGSSRRMFESEDVDPGDGWPPDPYRR